MPQFDIVFEKLQELTKNDQLTISIETEVSIQNSTRSMNFAVSPPK